MHRLALVISTAALAAGIAAGSASAGAVTQKFEGPFGGPSPCNGEFVFGTGPGQAVYEENEGHFVLHFAMRVKATGSLDNEYLLAVTANGQFDTPTLAFPDGITAFDMPVRLLAVSHGSAANYESLFTGGIFVKARVRSIATPRVRPALVQFGMGAAGLRLVDAVAGVDEAGLVGEHDELSPVADGELHHRSVDMRLDRER